MSKTDKLTKLANAIREYRGLTSTPVGAVDVVWQYHPKPSAGERVKRWLVSLGLNVEESMKKIDGFKRTNEFQDWLKTI